jgi:hypothetical protein
MKRKEAKERRLLTDQIQTRLEPTTHAFRNQLCMYKASKSKAIPVTGRGGLHGCGMLRIPHFLDNRFTDGGEVVNIARPPRFTQETLFRLINNLF